MEIKDIKSTIEKVVNIKDKTRAAIIKIILSVPENGEITVINANCFTVQSSVIFRMFRGKLSIKQFKNRRINKKG